MLRIIIAGSRFFEDYNLFESTMFKVLFHLNKEYPQYNILVINKEERLFKINPCSLEIISGMAKGTETWRYMLLQTMLLEFLFYFGTEKVKVVKI